MDEVKQELRSLSEGTKQAFAHIKREFDDHLGAINQNTSEIQSLYDFLSELDRRIEKLNERVDELQMYVNPEQEEVPKIQLTLREQEVFVTLYAAGGAVSVKDIGRRLGFTTEMVNKYVYNMISKGVPVLRSQEQGDMFIDLNPDFRTLQAKQNVVQVDEGIRRQVRAQEI